MEIETKNIKQQVKIFVNDKYLKHEDEINDWLNKNNIEVINTTNLYHSSDNSNGYTTYIKYVTYIYYKQL